MSEAKKPVAIDNYPVNELPQNWRGDFISADDILITIKTRNGPDACDGFSKDCAPATKPIRESR